MSSRCFINVSLITLTTVINIRKFETKTNNWMTGYLQGYFSNKV